MTARRAAIACWILALAARAVAALDPDRVERLYARGVYPRLAAVLGAFASRARGSLAEILVLGLGLAAGVLVLRGLRALWRGPERGTRLATGLGTALAVLGPLYLAFLLVWGLNYERLPFATTAGLDVRPAGAPELTALSRRLVAEADLRRASVAEDGHGVMRLEDGLFGAIGRVEAGLAVAGERYPWLLGPRTRVKPVRGSWVLSYLGISGVFFPFTGEPNVNATIPDPELPFVMAHETAHERGFAREDEANYLASLACRRHPDADFRYSGSLLASVHAIAALYAVDPAVARDLARSRSGGVQRDLAALRAWSDRYRTPIASVSEAVNDGYLRSQGQREGVRSYGRMVDLLVAEARQP
jgi:hypothetical protein